MKFPFYLINRIPPTSEGEKGVALQCTAFHGGIPPKLDILVSPSGTEAVIRKIQPILGDSYLVTIKGCMRSRIKEGGALLPLKTSCFIGTEALFVSPDETAYRGKIRLNPPEELKPLYPKGIVEARIVGSTAPHLLSIETRFPTLFIPLSAWTATIEENGSSKKLFCADKLPSEPFNKGEKELISGYFKKGVHEKGLFMLRLRLNGALFVPRELQDIQFGGYAAVKDLRISEKLLDKCRVQILRRASAQGGVRLSDLTESLGLGEDQLKLIIEERTAAKELHFKNGWIIAAGDPESRLSPTGKEVLRKMREKGTTGTRRILVKDHGLLTVIDELCRMELLFSDGDVILSREARDEIMTRITQARLDHPDSTPSDLARELGIQRKVIFTVLKSSEEEQTCD